MSATQIAASQLIDDLKRLISDSEELLRATASDASEKAVEVREKLSDAVAAAKRTCHRLEEKAMERAQDADVLIRDHPYESLGIAFGIGLLLGVVVSRR